MKEILYAKEMFLQRDFENTMDETYEHKKVIDGWPNLLSQTNNIDL